MAQRFDDHFTMMARDLGGCEAILDTFFGFLRRRTDFYKYVVQGGTKGGLPPGMHEQLMFSHYMKYREDYNRTNPPPPGINLPQMEVGPPPTDAQLERLVERTINPPPPKPEEAAPAAEAATGEPMQVSESTAPSEAAQQPPAQVPDLGAAKEPGDDWVVTSVQPRDNSISVFNGAKTDKYRWNQDIYTVQFQVAVPPGTRARDVRVDFDVKHIKVCLKSDLAHPVLEGELVERITPEDCVWLMDGDTVIVTMYKAKDVNWKGVLIGDPEIDPKTVDTTRRVDEYDADTQAGLNKALSQQALNLAGRMTEEQEEQYTKLKRMMGGASSPFKGHIPSPTQMFHLGPPKSPEQMEEEMRRAREREEDAE